MPSSIRYRNCCVTSWEDEPVFSPPMTYLVYQREKASTGILHWQCYVEFDRSVGLSKVKEFFGSKAHVEKRQGTCQEARKYCMKEDSRVDPPKEFGTISKQGERADLQAVSDMVKEGKTIRQVATEYPEQFVKFHSGICKLKNVLHPPPDRFRPEIIYIYGPPGVGKTRWAREKYPDAYMYVDSKNMWFDGYDCEDTIVFDEFVGSTPIIYMLKLLDYGKLSLPVKGGFVSVFATRFVFTSNFPPCDLYAAEKQYEAWMRRITEFSKFISGGTVLPATSAALTSASLVDRPENFSLVLKKKCPEDSEDEDLQSVSSLPFEGPSVP